MDKRMAIIDLGSNSIRMNIIGISETGGYTVFEQVSEMVRLSEGMSKNQTLKIEAVDRTIKALHYFKHLIKAYHVTEIYSLATAAIRNSRNGQEVVNILKEKTGFEFRVLSGDEEAYYDFLGVANTMTSKNSLIIDVGGGSTELIWMKNRKIQNKISLPFGSVTLTESFSSIHKAEDSIKTAFNDVKWLKKVNGYTIIGLGGVNRAIGKIHRSIKKYPVDNLHNYSMTELEVDQILSMIIKTPKDQRHKIEGLSKRRSEVIAFGILPLKVLMNHLNTTHYKISAYGLREGFFYEKLLSAANQPIPIPDVLNESVENMLNRFSINKTHSYTVSNMAVKLFLALNSDNMEDIKIIKIAGLLHDIGMHIDYHDHHVHGYYMVINGRLDGINNQERFEIAYLVGNHRELSLKKHYYANNPLLSDERLAALKRYAILVALSEQLDRSEDNLIDRVDIHVNPKTVLIEIVSAEALCFEVESAYRLKDSFVKLWKRDLIINIRNR